jgi:fumarylacetoacetate (FAA) hydrolase family protein
MTTAQTMSFTADQVLPRDVDSATLVARVATANGPSLCRITGGNVVDVTAAFPTLAHLLRDDTPAATLNEAHGVTLCDVATLIENSQAVQRDPSRPCLLAPVDLQAVKAAGVTFASSLVERTVEEAARGDPSQAGRVRQELAAAIGVDLGRIVPGSQAAEDLKTALQEKGLWSQYLEVGLGPDIEIFTKTQPLASVGHGEWIGLHPRSAWSNPEPEVVLVLAPDGQIVGATLGNDVNLRDFEGRSALLLGKAKDNNGSSALGPVVRLFDDGFGLDDLKTAEVRVKVTGPDGFVLDDASDMSQISRTSEEMARQLFETHHYPDGVVLFTGTLFAPVQDRDTPGIGFTHKPGDVVEIISPRLGLLANRVGLSTEIPAWETGALELFRSLARRGIAL